MSAKKALKGIALGAVLAGVAALAIKMKEEKNQKKVKQLTDQAEKVSKKVVKHALSLGKLTKSAYKQIVDTTLAEYRGVKDVSETELKELKAELLDSWSDIEQMLKCDEAKPASPAKKRPAKSQKAPVRVRKVTKK
jgi:gas vesicle protein